MLSLENRPFLVPALLLVGALVVYLLPLRWRRWGRTLAAAALLLAGWAALSLVPLISGGPVGTTLGESVPGAPLALRADQTGLVLVVASLSAALFALGTADRQPGEEAALLVTAAGASVAALAGNAVMLFAGAEIANLGGLLLASSGRGRVSRAAIAAFAVQHALALGLLAAAAQLVVSAGTSDPLALAPGTVGPSVALPWGLAGAGRLLAVGWWPGAAGGTSTRGWLAVGAVPCGAAILLRLGEATGGSADPQLTVALSAVGAAAALWGGVAAWRWQNESRRAGRALLVAAAGLPIAVTAVPGATGAVAAGLVALELALLAAPAWSQPVSPGRWGRVLAATALAAAAGLPIGFGATAAALELGAVAGLGHPYSPLLFALGTATVAAAAGGMVAARQALGSAALGDASALSPSGRAQRRAPPRPDAALALVLGAAAALVPGIVGAAVLTPLVGSGALTVVDSASLHVPGGPWPGGYLGLALVVVLLVVASAGILLGKSLPHPGHGIPGPRPRAAWVGLIAPRRALAPASRGLARGIAGVDAWLVAQPGLIFTVVAAIVALLAFRYL